MTTPVPQTAPAIEIRGLHRRVGRFALDDVDLLLPTGYVMGLVGPNGSGKTTTIKAALGLVRPDSGRLTLLDQPPGTPAVRERVGVVLDEPFLAPDWTVTAAGRRVGSFYRSWDGRYFSELLERFAVPTGRTVAQLSRGEGMKLMLALALAHRPELLVLDEPTSGLDPVSRTDVIAVLRDFMTDERHSILFSTHITSDLDGLADHLLVMNAGQVVHAAELESLREEFAVVRGTGIPDAAAAAALIGRRDVPGGYDGLIRLADSSRFDAAAVIEEATIDDVVVHLTRGADSPPQQGDPTRDHHDLATGRTTA